MPASKPYSYDEMQYPSRPKAETRPDRMGALAILHGLSPAPAGACRVLELGCADGGNLIPQAFVYPQSTFVGIDLGAGQIEAGRREIASLGLHNISLRHGDITALAADQLGTFDYIIVHGVFSWVPRPVQDAILRLFQSLLAENGIAFLSYNVYPGWHLRRMVRDMMQYHARAEGPLQAQVERGMEMLAYMASASDALRGKFDPTLDYESYARAIAREKELLGKQDPYYIAHEFFEETNEAFYFRDVAGRAASAGLQYICEARFSEMTHDYYPPAVLGSLETFAGDDFIEREQYLDFLRLRAFRQSLFCRAGLALERAPQPGPVRQLHVASPAQPLSESPDLHSNKVERFRGPSGTTINSGSPLGKAALLHLSRIWPLTIPFDDLYDEARRTLNPHALAVQGREQQAAEMASLVNILRRAHALEMVEFSSAALPVAAQIDDRPLASVLARRMGERGRQVVNLRHEIVDLDDDVTLRLLPLLDGTRDRTALLHALAGMAADGDLVVERNGKPITDEDEYMQALDDALALHVGRIHNAALLMPQADNGQSSKRDTR